MEYLQLGKTGLQVFLEPVTLVHKSREVIAVNAACKSNWPGERDQLQRLVTQ